MKELSNDEKVALAYKRLYNTIKTLRAPGGCPWDREQTPISMRKDLVEETFEAVDAISSLDAKHAKEELGDVMLNATMIAYMYEQQNDFTVSDALDELTCKLIRRHPHVFKNSSGKSEVTGEVKTGDEVLSQWDRIKENVEGRKTSSILDEIPKGFPPLLRAYKLQKKASKKGFDWTSLKDVFKKVKEEFSEVKAAIKDLQKTKKTNDKKNEQKAFLHLEEECGDLLFALINYMRHLDVNPEIALERANNKFYDRFCFVENSMKKANIEMSQANLKLAEKFWQEAKNI